MDSVYFISDAHLGAKGTGDEGVRHHRLIGFLRHLQGRADYLYIVGDFFDFWFEYRHAIPKINLKIVAQLVRLVEEGTTVRYLAGNHDVWLRDYLEGEIGLTIARGPLEVVHNGLRVYVAHGDDLVQQDRKHRFLRRLFTHPLNVFLYRWLHPDLGIPLARFFSHLSRQKGPYPYEAENREFALEKLSGGFDCVILGHSHNPTLEVIDGKYYVNLGDWLQNFTYLELSADGPQLRRWSSTESELSTQELGRMYKV